MKYHIHTYGCQMNVRDSEAVGALLESRGIARAADEDEADIVLVNTCSVRAKAEDKALGKLGLLCASKRERPGRVIGVMGCMAQRMAKDLFQRLPGLNLVVGTRATALVPDAVSRALAGERRICLTESPKNGDSEFQIPDSKFQISNPESGRSDSDIVDALAAGRLPYPRFTPQEIQSSHGKQHDTLWHFILSLESAKVHERGTSDTARSGEPLAPRDGEAARALARLGTRVQGDPRDRLEVDGVPVKQLDRGAESVVFLMPDGTVRKIRQFHPNDINSVLDELAKVVYHNHLFPGDAYRVRDILVGDIQGREAYFLALDQDLVVPKTTPDGFIVEPSEAQIREALRQLPRPFSVLGGASESDESGSDDDSNSDTVPVARFLAYDADYVVYDFKPGRNTFLDAETGAVRFIDPRIQINDPSIPSRAAFAGKRKIFDGFLDLPEKTSTFNLQPSTSSRADVVTAHEPGALSAFVTILLGCERKCAYCIVPTVRGSEYSRPGADVVREVAEVVASGAHDVTLLGQSVMRYGVRTPVWPDGFVSPMGFTEPLPRLFEAVHAAVPGLRRVRFTSGHPSGVTPELIRAMAEIPGVCPHLHLPVQSGSDRILATMGRGYTREKYLDSVARLRAAVPDIAITTDVIVGFPGETDEDFEMTRTLLEEAAVDNVFVFKYSPRPGTRSSLWPDDVSAAEKMRRNQVLLADQDRRGQALNEAWIGRTVEVLAEGPSLRNKDRWAGRSPQNKIVVFDPVPGIAVGDFVQVEITEAQPQTLHGKVRGQGLGDRD